MARKGEELEFAKKILIWDLSPKIQRVKPYTECYCKERISCVLSEDISPGLARNGDSLLNKNSTLS